MKTLFRSSVLCLLLTYAFPLSAQRIIWVTGESLEVKIPFEDIGVYEDTTAQLSFEDIRKSSFQQHFQNNTYIAESGSSNYWLKLVFMGEALKNQSWFLEGRDPNTKYLDFYIPDGTGGYTQHSSGNFLQHRSRTIPHKNYLAEFPQGVEEVTVFVRMATYQKNYFVFRLKRVDFLMGYALNEYMLLGIFYGILLIMATYNLVLYGFIKEKIYLLYVFYVLSAMLMCMGEDGLGFQYLWPNLPMINAYIEKIAR
ncbi:MAG: 7TM-DISM domain-containing protein, partial [Bacteroidota bacterium]